MVLEATSLLRMVLQKLDSVLLERNLKSCARKKEVVSDAAETSAKRRCSTTYSHEKMLIKILALRVLLRLFLDSTAFVQINALDDFETKVSQCVTRSAEACEQTSRKRPRAVQPLLANYKSNLPFFLVAYICIK